MRSNIAVAIACVCSAVSLFASQKTTIAALPLAVQGTVKEQTKNATILNIVKEVEKGKTVYEVESKVNGKTRDFVVDGDGNVLDIEEETELASVPAAVKQTIDKQSAGGVVKRVERLIQGPTMRYEVAITKKGKTSEITVNGDGSIHKD